MNALKGTAIPVVALSSLLIGCGREVEKRGEPTRDFGLRQYLGVSSIVGDCDIPADKGGFLIALLEFEDGKLVREGSSQGGPCENPESRRITAEILWSTKQDSPDLSIIIGGMTITEKNNFWSKLDGGRMSVPRNGEREYYAGYAILGFAASSTNRQDKSGTFMTTDLTSMVEHQKRVGALGVKTFKTRAEAENEVNRLHRAGQ